MHPNRAANIPEVVVVRWEYNASNVLVRSIGDDQAKGSKAMKVRDIIRLLEDDEWYLVATKGSHRQYKYQMKKRRVTIAGHNNDDLAPGTLNSILKQAQLREKR